MQPVSTKPDSPQFPWVTCAIRPSRHRRAESGRSPGALAKLGPLARGSSLTGALFRAPGKFDIRASEPSFVKAPGRPADSYKLKPLGISPGSFQALPDHAKYVQTTTMSGACPVIRATPNRSLNFEPAVKAFRLRKAPGSHGRAESGRTPGALAKLGPLSRGSGLTGALFRAPVNSDIRESEPSFARAPGRPSDSAKQNLQFFLLLCSNLSSLMSKP